MTQIPELDDSREAPPFTEELNQHDLAEEPNNSERPERDDDPVWTWNAPPFLTGDDYGIHQKDQPKLPTKELQAHEQMLAERMSADAPWLRRDFTLREKVENLRTYFGSKEQFEKTKGGRTHYKAILSFDVQANNTD